MLMFVNDFKFLDDVLTNNRLNSPMEINKYLNFAGFSKKDLTINYDPKSRYLFVETKPDNETYKGYKMYINNQNYDVEAIKVTMKHGLLNVKVPLKEEAKPIQINIE